MISLAWGGYRNGAVPESATTVIDAAGHRLEHVAASKFLAMRQACFAATGKWLNAAPGSDSANRTVAQQEHDYALYQAGGNVAAVPGTSNHGWARAIDITGYETAASHWANGIYVNDGPEWAWLMAHIGTYGYSWDTGKASGESWHLESYNAPSALAAVGDTTPIQEEEEDVIYPWVFITKDNSVGGVWYKYDGRAKYACSPTDPQLLVDLGLAAKVEVKVLGSKIGAIPTGTV